MVSRLSKKFPEDIVIKTVNILETLDHKDLADLLKDSDEFYSNIIKALNLIKVEELEWLKNIPSQQNN